VTDASSAKEDAHARCFLVETQTMSKMTKSERVELAQLIRRREKIAKSDVERVAAERLAQFEKDAASVYRSDDDEVWAEQKRIALHAVADANVVIAERCRELGILD
jgi:hypothetical protein